MDDTMRLHMIRSLLNDYFKGRTEASAEAVLYEVNDIAYGKSKGEC